MKTGKMHYTYLLRCADDSLYCGYTTDPARREKEHNDSVKGAKYTRTRRPVKLVYSEAFDTKSEAMRREWEIKHLTHADKEKIVDSSVAKKDA